MLCYAMLYYNTLYYTILYYTILLINVCRQQVVTQHTIKPMQGGFWRPGAEDTDRPSYVKSSSSVSGYRFRYASTVSEALFGLLNTPHPLDILADPNAYGPKGKISLYHNPYNYTSTLNDIIRNSRNK